MCEAVKGSIANPYSYEEFQALLSSGAWNGGFVGDETGAVYYFKNGTTTNDENEEEEEEISGCGCGSGSDDGGPVIEDDNGCGTSSWDPHAQGDDTLIEVEGGSCTSTIIDNEHLQFEIGVTWTNGIYNQLSGSGTSSASVNIYGYSIAENGSTDCSLTYQEITHFWAGAYSLEVTINYRYTKGSDAHVYSSRVTSMVACTA